MKTNKKIKSIVICLITSLSIYAQENNLVMNGSFENTSRKISSSGQFSLGDNISSSNNTSVDIYSKNACGHDYNIPKNYMGMQDTKTGNNYAGIVAYYADETGFIKTKPGYQKYTEYIQLMFAEPLVAGKAYAVSFNISLAEKSAYAVSGLGVYFSTDKIDVKNNSFLQVMPHVVSTDILTDNNWTSFTGTYIANGGERYLTLGCFNNYMQVKKIIEPYTNNSRKAYYYIDEVSLSPKTITNDDVTKVLLGSCYQLSNLNFETDKAVIMSSSYNELQLLSFFLKKYPYITVYIDGYTDQTGTMQHNDILSKDRAMAVKTYLTNEGVSSDRLKIKGYGERFPLDEQNENSIANRRVEITICSNYLNTSQTKR